MEQQGKQISSQMRIGIHARDSSDIGASDLHSYPVEDVAETRVLRSRHVQQHRVLNSHHSSIERARRSTWRGVPRVFFFLPLIPDRPVNEIDAASAGQVNYAELLPPGSPQGPLTVDR